MENDAPSEHLFRANKRRKVFRKRANSVEDEATAEAGVDSPAVANIQEAAEGEENDELGVVRFQKKPGVKNRGIAFTSSNMARPVEESEERAVVVADDSETPAAIQGDRFVKPTGKVVITENKHMVAYIDSKLAELRSTTRSTAGGTKVQFSPEELSQLRDEAEKTKQQDVKSPVKPAAAPTTFDSAQSRSSRVYQRPSKRKQPPPREQTDVARDSIIDQIMQESQVPIYDRSGSHTPAQDSDNDAATAQAFKAQLLAEMEEQNRRRPAPRNPAATSGASSMQSGPKLGGSRSQREKMRALEEAKGKPSTGKK